MVAIYTPTETLALSKALVLKVWAMDKTVLVTSGKWLEMQILESSPLITDSDTQDLISEP